MTKDEKVIIQHTRDCLEIYLSVIDMAIDSKKKIPAGKLEAMAEEMSTNIADLEKMI